MPAGSFNILVLAALILSVYSVLGCDTWIALRDATAGGRILFAKNSDRVIFDSQPLALHPRRRWEEGARIDLGRVSLPQVAETYLIADPNEAWVLDSAGTHWTVRKIETSVASISNSLSLNAGDMISVDAIRTAEQKGWWTATPGAPFDFAKAFGADAPAQLAGQKRAAVRAACSLGLMRERIGSIDEFRMMRIARDRSTNPSLDLDVTASSCVVAPPENAGGASCFLVGGFGSELRDLHSLFRSRLQTPGGDLRGGDVRETDRPARSGDPGRFRCKFLLVALPGPCSSGQRRSREPLGRCPGRLRRPGNGIRGRPPGYPQESRRPPFQRTDG